MTHGVPSGKLEEREVLPAATQEWTGQPRLTEAEAKLGTLRRKWTESQITDEMFFATTAQIEAQIRALRNDQARATARVVRADRRFAGVRKRWYGGELDLSQKRAYIREALVAVVIRPVPIRGRVPFDPDLIEPVWRQ